MNKLLKNSRFDSNGWPRETGFVEAEVITLESDADEDANNSWLKLCEVDDFLLLKQQ